MWKIGESVENLKTYNSNSVRSLLSPAIRHHSPGLTTGAFFVPIAMPVALVSNGRALQRHGSLRETETVCDAILPCHRRIDFVCLPRGKNLEMRVRGFGQRHDQQQGTVSASSKNHAYNASTEIPLKPA